jgi:hypothetical protein
MILSPLLTCDICWVYRICLCPPCWHVTYSEWVHVNNEDKNIIYTLSICHISTRRTKTYSTHSAYVTCQEGGQKHILHTQHMSHECVEYVFVLLVDMCHMLSVYMFLSSLLTCDICWVCRIWFCPPCWHVTYAECAEYVLVHMSHVNKEDKTYSTHSAYVTCQRGGQKHILHTQHMSCQ